MNSKTWQITAGAVLAIGAAAAVVLGGTRAKEAVTLPEGTELVATLEQDISTAHSKAGDGVTLLTVEPIQVGDNTVPEGVEVYGSIVTAKGGGSIAGAPELALRFTALELDGERHDISADAFHVTGRNEAGKSAAQIGGGAVAGGVVGRVLGGKDGTVPGAVVGAVIGTGVALDSPGDELVLPAGQRLRIRLSAPVTVSYRPHGDTREETDR
jgi:hypothetical protein